MMNCDMHHYHFFMRCNFLRLRPLSSHAPELPPNPPPKQRCRLLTMYPSPPPLPLPLSPSASTPFNTSLAPSLLHASHCTSLHCPFPLRSILFCQKRASSLQVRAQNWARLISPFTVRFDLIRCTATFKALASMLLAPMSSNPPPPPPSVSSRTRCRKLSVSHDIF